MAVIKTRIVATVCIVATMCLDMVCPQREILMHRRRLRSRGWLNSEQMAVLGHWIDGSQREFNVRLCAFAYRGIDAHFKLVVEVQMTGTGETMRFA